MSEVETMKKLSVILAFLLSASFSHAQEQQHWSYEGATGPAHWADLKPDYSICKTGQEQSPIDIVNPVAEKLPPIEFHYLHSPLKLIDNGHTVQVNYAPGSYITVSEKRYELVQFHYHHPSEEAINGKHYDLVIHLVHKDAEGHLAVVAVLFNEGASNAGIKAVVEHIPTVKEKEIAAGATVDATSLLPQTRSYYTFRGSLTTPPCSEGVTWFVLQTPSTLSNSELQTLLRLYAHNARPVQPVNARKVKAEN
jgi:carbonic anhydrase